MRRVGELLVLHRFWVWGLVLLLSVPPGLGLLGYRWIEPASDDWGEFADWADLSEAQESFTFIGLPALIVANCDDVFVPQRIAALQEVVRRLAELETVADIVWVGDFPHWTWSGLQPLLPQNVGDDADLQHARNELLRHPLVEGQLVSSDGKVLLIPLVMHWGSDAVADVRATLHDTLDGTGISTRLTGAVPLWLSTHNTQAEEHAKILLTAIALVVILAFAIFRRPSAILIACSGPAVGVIWTEGWLHLLGRNTNELAQIIVPVMVLMIGFTDGVHLVVDMRQRRAAGLPPRDAAAQSIDHVGMACLLTSLTTAIGFGSLLIGRSEMIKGFGLAAAIGVLVTFVAVLLLTPLLGCSWLGRRLHRGQHRDLVGRNIERLSVVMNPVVKRAPLFAIGGVLLTVVLSTTALQLEPDDRLAHRVPNQSEAYQALLECDRAVGGIRVMQVVVKWNEASDEAIWQVMHAVHEALDREELISRPTSILNCLELVPGPDSSFKLWWGSKAIPQEVRDQFWQPELRMAQFIVRLQDLGMTAYKPALTRLQHTIDALEERHPGVTIKLTGEVLVDSKVVARNVQELMQSLTLAGVIIVVVIAVAFRSLRYGLISIIPNLLPLAAAASLRLMMDVSLDIASACSFAICLGIAVDDTIHFVTRFRHERAAGHDAPEAVRRAFITVGTALAMTTVVLMAGFASVLSSQLPTHTLFAAMALTTIGIALPADLFLLPALLCCCAGSAENADNGAAKPQPAASHAVPLSKQSSH